MIVDTKTRNIAAQYAAYYMRGCLIGNEYWVCVEDRVIRKPFPAMEEAPPLKQVGGWDTFYSKHPELW